ncbi:hypothetical protein CR513_01942, partial [Mucuna pruriens]
MRAQIRESEEVTLAVFLYGMNRKIQDVVDLQHYRNLSELVHQAIKVEMQIRRRSASRNTYVGSNGWNDKEKEKTLFGHTEQHIELCWGCLPTGSSLLIVVKLRSRWDGPFVITNVFPYGVVELKDEHTNNTFQANGHQIKLFHEGLAPIIGDMGTISLMEPTPPYDTP